MIRAACVERTLDAPPVEACPTARIHVALRGNAVPSGDRRGDGLLRQLGDLAAAWIRRSVLLSEALRDLRAPRPDRDAGHGDTGAETGEDLHPAAAGRGLRADSRRQAARHWRERERRIAL